MTAETNPAPTPNAAAPAANPATQAEVVAELSAMIADAAVRPPAIATLLDGLSAELRPATVRELGPRLQRALYEKVAGFAAVRLSDLVPDRCGPGEEVRHLGRNTLPAFRIFEKRLCRLPGTETDADDSVAGYNFQTMAAITGPGYFLARNDVEHAEVLVDYGRLPDSAAGVLPPGWPAVRSNERGLGRFVYGFMVDRLRRVSEHVTIGSAARKGKDLGSYFVLSRMDSD